MSIHIFPKFYIWQRFTHDAPIANTSAEFLVEAELSLYMQKAACRPFFNSLQAALSFQSKVKFLLYCSYILFFNALLLFAYQMITPT